jgi:hypothetical protein
MSILRFVKPGDIVLGGVLLAAAGVLGFGTGSRYAGEKHVVVEVSGERVMELSLDSDVTRTVRGPLGDTVIKIEGGTVRVIDSACPNDLCIKMGSISSAGDAVVCVPNHVIVTIRGGKSDEELDGVTK